MNVFLMMPFRLFLLPLLFTAVMLASCAPTDELRDEEMDQLLDKAFEDYADLAEHMDELVIDEDSDEDMVIRLEERAEALLEELPELAVDLQAYRSRLADLQTGVRNEIPVHYMQPEKPEETRDRADQNHGFRIQIISTQDARLADEIREDFEEWISSVSAPPQPRTYMVFQQPYYRVQVGDFLDRRRANEFTDFVRLRYPDAWVIHSQIHPGRVER